jgi:hypothetical protein
VRQYAALGLGLALTTGGLAVIGFEMYDVLSVVALGLCALAWWAWWVWRRAAQHRPNPIVRERAVVAGRDAVVASIVGFIGVRRLLDFQGVPSEAITLLLVAALLAVCLYPLRLLVWYYRGEFEEPH